MVLKIALRGLQFTAEAKKLPFGAITYSNSLYSVEVKVGGEVNRSLTQVVSEM